MNTYIHIYIYIYICTYICVMYVHTLSPKNQSELSLWNMVCMLGLCKEHAKLWVSHRLFCIVTESIFHAIERCHVYLHIGIHLNRYTLHTCIYIQTRIFSTCAYRQGQVHSMQKFGGNAASCLDKAVAYACFGSLEGHVGFVTSRAAISLQRSGASKGFIVMTNETLGMHDMQGCGCTPPGRSVEDRRRVNMISAAN